MYGLIIALAALICFLIGEYLVNAHKYDTDAYWGASLWLLVGGTVGARAYHVIDLWDYYSADPIKILFFHQGGLGIYGAIIGGAIGFILYLKLIREDPIKYLDIAAVLIPLGQGIGRWANLANTELFGMPTSLPWGIYIPPRLRPEQFIFNDMYHPLFLYESLLDILLFFLLFSLYQGKSMKLQMPGRLSRMTAMRGFYTLVYITGYGLIRYFLENMRITSWHINSYDVAQAISLIFIFSGISGLALLYSTATKLKNLVK